MDDAHTLGPDDNDVQNYGPDRAIAADEIRYLQDEGLDTAKVVHRFVSDWTEPS